VPERSSRVSYSVNVKHTTYYLFQKQGLVANKDLLFYRQSEEHLPQAIRDTFGVLFGISQLANMETEANRRATLRELRVATKELRSAEEAEDGLDTKGVGLLAEARAVGIPFGSAPAAGVPEGTTPASDLLVSLRQVLSWRPGSTPLMASSEMAKVQERRLSLRMQRNAVQGEIAATQRYVKRGLRVQE